MLLTTTAASAVRLFVVFLASPAAGTFLQWSLCDDSHGSGIIPFYLNAWLESPGENAPTSRLAISLVRHQSGITCRDTPAAAAADNGAWPEATVQLDWTALNGHGTFSHTTRAQLDCDDFIGDHRPIWLPVNSSRVSMTLLPGDDIGELPALSTIRLQAHLNTTIFDDATCISSLLTPAISPGLSSGLRYGPLSVFIFVFLVSVLRSVAAASEPQLEHKSEVSASNMPVAAPALLPLTANCLHFLQFVFLTGGLSLAFPGFYPAAAGQLNWFALFANLALPLKSFYGIPAPLPPRMVTTYSGVRDGLYQVNGTYGGYPGFEVMSQIVGSPMTCDTWLLMVLFTACIAIALGLFLWLLETVRPRNVLGLPLLAPGAGTGRRALAVRVGNGVLRLVLSYITLPLIALSTYQLTFSGSLGAAHMALAIVVLLIIIVAFIWLAVRVPAATLGAMVFDRRHRYQRVWGDEAAGGGECAEERAQARRDDIFVMALFVLDMIRGLTIGGLQQWGVVQLAVLMACEVFLLMAVRILRPFPPTSSSFAVIPLRLIILACFVPSTFRPSRLLNVKSIACYAALLLYAVGLIGLFFIPSCWHLYRLMRERLRLLTGEGVVRDAPVIGLRQLQRRDASASPPSHDYHSMLRTSPPLDGKYSLSRDYEPSGNKWDPRHDAWPTRRLDRSHDSQTSRFYRSPRSPTPAAPGEASRFFNNSALGSRASSRSPFTPSASPPASSDGSVDSGSASALSDVDLRNSLTWAGKDGARSVVSVASEADSTMPLGPRWNDYSFREADLFYTAPPPRGTPSTESSPPASVPSSSKVQQKMPWEWNLVKGWSLTGRKSTPPAERGFSVVRPNRAPHPQHGLAPAARPGAVEEDTQS